MTKEDSQHIDDLLKRRMSSGAETSDSTRSAGKHATAEHGTHESATSATFADEDTQRFDPLTDSTTTSTPASTNAATKPELMSNEEWALITGEPAVTDQRSGAKHDVDASREMDFPADRRRSPLDVIGTIWITLSVPFIIFALAVRAVASSLFLRFEYFLRPGFPADSFGFSKGDREHYASYVIDYLHNFDTSRYLADVVLPNGQPVFISEELAHMADVKNLISLLYLIAIVAAVGTIIFGLLLTRRNGMGLRHGVRFGALLTLLIAVLAGVFGALGWDRFFTSFHQVFFKEGTWQFYLDDSLIRLFPGQFWVDAGIAAGALVLLLSLVLLGLSFLGHKRRKARRIAAAEANV